MTTPLFNRYSWLAGCCGMLITSISYTAPGSLEQTPLFTATTNSGGNAPANIFFDLDDSGSMDWSLLSKKYWMSCLYDPVNKSNGTSSCPAVNNVQADGGFETYSTTSNSISNQNDLSGYTTGTLSASWLYDWRPRSADFNILYYNPNVTYLPWLNGDGTRMANASFTAAKDDPFQSTRTGTTDLTNFVFEVWHDTHGYSGTVPAVTLTSSGAPTTTTVPTTATVNGTPTQLNSVTIKTTDPVTKNVTNTTTINNSVVNTITNTNTITTINSNPTIQGVNRTVGANGWVDFWDEHSTYTVGATGITQADVTYTPTVSTTLTAATTTTPLTITTSSTATGTPTTTTTTTTTSSTKKNIVTTNITISNTATRVDVVTKNVTTTSTTGGIYTLTLNPTGYTPTTTTLAAGLNNRTLADEKTNIANWYQYYRRRINVARGAIGDVIDGNPNYRYGYSTIWNNAFVTVPPVTTTATADVIAYNKDLLTSSSHGLYYRSAGNSTPLPDATERVGRYFMHQSVSGTTYADPITYECQQNFHILFTDGYWNSNNTSHGDVDGDGTSDTLADVTRYYYNTDLSTLANKVPINNFDLNNQQHMVTYTVAFGLKGNLVDVDGDGWPDPSLLESSNWGVPSATTNSGQNPENIDDLWHAAFNSKGLYVSASSPEAVAAGFKTILNNITQRNYAGSASAASFNASPTLAGTAVAGTNMVYQSQFGLTNNIWSGDMKAYSLHGGVVNSIATWSATDRLSTLTTPQTDRHIFTYNPNVGTGVPFQWLALSAGTTAAPTISTAQKDLGTSPTGTVTTGTPASPDAAALARLNYLRGDQSQEGSAFRTRAYTDVGNIFHKNLLGDIIHSEPVLVSSPNAAWPVAAPSTTSPFPTDTSYRTFKTVNEGRNAIVYTGGNDGMLHGFDSDNGDEVMAYIPNLLFNFGTATSGLHYLTNTTYTHRYYVDNTPVVEDVYINTGGLVGVGGSGLRWHTVLVGGLGAGGRGVYALDVTDPTLFLTENSANAAKIALWEFNNVAGTGDADMGYSYSTPSIVPMNNGRWAAVFGNGYNNTGSGKAALFIVFLDGGVDGGAWTPAVDYIKIMLPTPSTNPNGVDSITSSDCTNSASNCNGLSTPQTIDLNGDSKIDRIYAGDLKGNMWAIDVSAATTSSWAPVYGTATFPLPLFMASHHVTPYVSTGTGAYSATIAPSLPTTGSGLPVQQSLCGTVAAPTVCRQPITTRPKLLINPQSFGYNPPNVLVMFGTGQYLNLPDTGSSTMQSFYGVWDSGARTNISYPLTPATAKASSTTTPAFVEQVYLPGPFFYTPPATAANPTPTAVDISATIRVLSNLPVNYNNSQSSNLGWFINLSKDSTIANRNVSAGERQIVNTNILDQRYLFFNTWIPGTTSSTSTDSSNLCAVQGNSSGSGFLMSVNLFTGGAADKALFSLNGSNPVSKTDIVKCTACSTGLAPSGQAYTTGLPSQSSFLPGQQFTLGTGTPDDKQRTVIQTTGEKFLRRAWQELRNQ